MWRLPACGTPHPLWIADAAKYSLYFRFFRLTKQSFVCLNIPVEPEHLQQETRPMPPRSTPKASRPRGTIRAEVLAFVRERLAAGSPPTVLSLIHI